MAPLKVVFRSSAAADMDQINAIYALVDEGRLVARFWRAVDEAVEKGSGLSRELPTLLSPYASSFTRYLPLLGVLSRPQGFD